MRWKRSRGFWMRSKFRIEEFEPIYMEKSLKTLDKRLNNAQDSLEQYKILKEEEASRSSLWGSLKYGFGKIFGLHP